MLMSLRAPDFKRCTQTRISMHCVLVRFYLCVHIDLHINERADNVRYSSLANRRTESEGRKKREQNNRLTFLSWEKVLAKVGHSSRRPVAPAPARRLL